VYQHAEHGINEASRKFGQSSENHRSYLRAFLLFEMASSANFNNVLKQLTAIFRRLNSGEDALSELRRLKEHCARVLAEERRRAFKVSKVRSCEFSKLQFPKSQKDRSVRCEPVM
jgi:exonuclease VII small subunit